MVEFTPYAPQHEVMPTHVSEILPMFSPTSLACGQGAEGYHQRRDEEDEDSVVDLDDGEQWVSADSRLDMGNQSWKRLATDPDFKAFYSQIPLNENGELSSVGSMAHSSGRCSPCIVHFQLMCVKGVGCSYCHLSHAGQRKKRIH